MSLSGTPDEPVGGSLGPLFEQPEPVVTGRPARCRSFCFLERHAGRGGREEAAERWTVFLVTRADEEGHWRGHFWFRRGTASPDEAEVRTANLFVEDSEAELDARARSLGRPLLLALLESALHTHERKLGAPAAVRAWFKEFLARHSAELIPDITQPSELTYSHLRSMYDSYRLDQVAHLISLIEPGEFRALVDKILDGREVDFRTRDRLQLAMIVVQDIETRMPLPPFEVWVEDYIAHREAYQRYAFALHRGEALP